MIIAAIAVVLTVFNRCTKDNSLEITENVRKPDVCIENGYLAFKNMNSVDSVINVLSKMSHQEKDEWEQNMGLKSARFEFEKLFDEYEKLTSLEEFLKFKEKYSSQLKFNERDETDCSIAYPYKTNYFLPVLNSQGIYKVGNSVIKYTKEDQIIILNGDLKVLNNLEANIGNENLIIMPRLKSDGQVSEELYYFLEDNPVAAENPGLWVYNAPAYDRRFRDALWRENYWYDYGVPCSGWKVYLYQTGQTKGVFGKWIDYKTEMGLRNVSIKIGNYPTQFFTGNPNTSDVYSSTTVLAEGFISGSNSLYNYKPTVIFSGEVYSRGIGYWWPINN